MGKPFGDRLGADRQSADPVGAVALIASLAMLVLAKEQKEEPVNAIPPERLAPACLEVSKSREGRSPLAPAETAIELADHGEPPGMKKPAEAGLWIVCRIATMQNGPVTPPDAWGVQEDAPALLDQPAEPISRGDVPELTLAHLLAAMALMAVVGLAISLSA